MDFPLLHINGYPMITVGWNILLASVPFLLGTGIQKIRGFHWPRPAKLALIGMAGFLWMVFIPNTAYIITDVRHLNNYCPLTFENVCPQNAWLVMVFFLYSLIGWISYVYSMRQMRTIISDKAGPKKTRFIIAAIIPVISLGLLLGLLDRWNSWEIFLDPLGVVNDALSYIYIRANFLNLAVFTLGMYALYYGGDFLFIKRTAQAEKNNQA